MNEIKRAKRLPQALVHFVTARDNFVYRPRFKSRLSTILPPFPILLFFFLMVVKTWCRDFVQLLNYFVCQFAISFHTFLRMSFHVVTPRSNVCIIFSDSSNFSVGPAEIRDSNIFLYSSNKPSFGLHSCWVHPNYTWSINDVRSSKSTCFIKFFHMGSRFGFFPANLMASTCNDRTGPC